MPSLVPILTITGSDGAGVVGIQADIRTISALGGYALTAITSVTTHDENGATSINDITPEMIIGQVRAVVKEWHPKVTKIGLVRDVTTIKMLKKEIVASQKIVLVPGIFSSDGSQIIPDAAVAAIKKHLVPMATLLILRCNEAEKMLYAPRAIGGDELFKARHLADREIDRALDKIALKPVLYDSDDDPSRLANTPIGEKALKLCRHRPLRRARARLHERLVPRKGVVDKRQDYVLL